jgi:hypothetical protein
MDLWKQVLRLTPDDVALYDNLAVDTMASQRLEETRQIIREVQGQRLDDYILHDVLYGLAFLRADSTAMAEQRCINSIFCSTGIDVSLLAGEF